MSGKPAVAVRGLSVHLGGKEILKGVDMEVQAGDLYGLLGRNGAGKTTAMRCLLGYLPFEGGSCEMLGVSSRNVHLVEFPYGVALDPPGLDDTLTLRQNLELAQIRGGIRDGRGVAEVLDLVGLSHRQHNLGDRLSHGQGRRAAVARALLGNPKLLVLDEPLSGLDPEGVERMLALFRTLADEQGVTVVLSSHHLREVEHVCNRVGLIEDGETILEGETRHLLTAAGDGLLIRARKEDLVREIVSNLEGVEGPPQKREDHLELRVGESFDAAAALTRLVQGGAEVEEYTRHRASLVDVFHQALSAAGKTAAAPLEEVTA
ncbi:MAG: ABC transporter ATP-binding protein [Planctomycetota bacterium]